MSRLGCGVDLASRRTALPVLDALGPFRFRAVGDRVLLTGEAGEHALVTRAEFQGLLDGHPPPDGARRTELLEKGFLAGGRPAEVRGVRRAAQRGTWSRSCAASL